MSAARIVPLLATDALVDGRYRIVRTLGVGSCGVVYEAVQMPLGRAVALKVIHRDLVGHPDLFALRFFGEASRAARLSHPNSLCIYDYGCTTDGRFFIAMELVTGRPLAEALWARGALPVEDALSIASLVAGSLVDAHAHGCVHGQLSVHSVFLSAHGRGFLKVADYGQRLWLWDELDSDRLELIGAARGRQMAPEQLRGDAPTMRSDVYALGLLLHEMLSGRMAFAQSDCTAVLVDKLRGADGLLHDLSLPPLVARVLRFALAADPRLRYPSVRAMAAALRDARHSVRHLRPVTWSDELADDVVVLEEESGSVSVA